MTEAEDSFDGMIKAVVDIDQEIMALGGEWHSDAERILLEAGSQQQNLWGINLLLERPKEQMIEFTSLINIRPQAGNRTMMIEIPSVKEKINQIVIKLIF